MYTKLLTMDAIELTLLLKAIGFRLNSIDFDEHRFTNGKSKLSTQTPSKPTMSPLTQSDYDHYVNIEITCSKSKIVSHLSYKLDDNDATNGATTQLIKSTKSNVCTCPKPKTIGNNNSFWEVQSTGSFANQKRSMNGLLIVSNCVLIFCNDKMTILSVYCA